MMDLILTDMCFGTEYGMHQKKHKGLWPRRQHLWEIFLEEKVINKLNNTREGVS
jgi:hypothetical protein